MLCNIPYLLALSCFYWLRGVASSCETRTLYITADNKLELYINGIHATSLPNANDWTKSDNVVLPCETSVIAVKATDLHVVGGILASTVDGSILTNSSWKCTNVYYDGWQLVNFDDSSWPSAYAIALHQTLPWTLVPGIKTNAYWIWTPKYQGGDLVVYCRKDLAPPVPALLCPSRKLTITVDNSMRLYIDGTEKTGLVNANDWTKADTVDLPWTTRVIAVQGTDLHVVGGILASTDDGSILTDSTWKCTNVLYRGWQLVDFDDSSWPSAYVISLHQTFPWTLVPGIKTNAYWIWTPKYQGGDLVIYCRKYIAPSVPLLPCPRKLSITVDNQMRLYVDGTEKTGLVNANDWMKADTVDLPSNARVIAVQGIDLHVVGGILASTDDGSILTDSSWKCTNVLYKGWQLVDFDDSSWPSAYAISLHQTTPWTLVPGIKTNAYWIWTPKYQGGDLVVYCRKYIVPPVPLLSCPSRKLTITVDNQMRLYVDGTEKTGLVNANDWMKADTVDLPWTARVIAVQGTDLHVVGGILASTDDGSILTDSSWKCTNVLYRGWQLIGFDDSSWPSAYVISLHQTTPWTLVPGIKTNAYWIWTPKNKGGDLVVYCRKNLAMPRPCGIRQ